MNPLCLRFPGGKEKALTFSYDDGVVEDARLIEIFRKYGMRATFNLNSGHMDRKDLKREHIPSAEAVNIYTEDVCEVACHGATHASLPFCDSVTMLAEVLDDRKNLEKLFGRQVHGMAYPHVTFDETVISVLKNAGIFYSRIGSSFKFHMATDWYRLQGTCHHDYPGLMDLADRFLRTRRNLPPKVFYVFGHSFEFADNNNWDVIEAFCEKMARKDDIWYCTNIELYNAWADYQRLERSADGTQIYNPSARSVWVGDKNGNTWEIKPGESVICV